MSQLYPIRHAILSVSKKEGILEFAKSLHQRKVKLIATGGTAKFLLATGLNVTEISDYTKWPEIMNGRLKTLHPKVHGGILGRRDKDNEVMRKYHIIPIDMVVVNLYSFEKVITNADCKLEDAIEKIDIGGSAMIRAAAKNYKDVAIVVNTLDYSKIIQEMDQHQNSITEIFRFDLAKKAFKYIAAYDEIIANYFDKLSLLNYSKKNHLLDKFPYKLNLNFIKHQDIRYGENSHQAAAFYTEEKNRVEGSIATAKQLQGKSLSYNNIADADTALECVKNFFKPTCVIVKHGNPSSVASSNTLCSAYNNAFKADPRSAFGGIIAFNFELDVNTAKTIIKRQFVEVIIAPSINDTALTVLKNKPNIRVLASGQWNLANTTLDFKRVNGGLLVQDRDLKLIDKTNFCVVSKRQPTPKEIESAMFCWKVVKFVKSNAIVYGKNNMTIGIGAGQMSRIYSAKIAALKAQDENLNLIGCTMASDAFFTFRDAIDTASRIGISCIIQPGGSIHDNEIIAAVDAHNIAMIFTNMRHFRH